MSITLKDVVPSLTREGCPDYVIAEAIQSGRQVAKIVWDEPDTPDHCKGYVQWSVRPYRVTDRCDGTRDSNAILACMEFCKSTGLDLANLYEQAYPEENNHIRDAGYLEYLEEHRGMTDIPAVSENNIIQLLNSLYAMNWRSLVEVLVESWANKGFNTEKFWEKA